METYEKPPSIRCHSCLSTFPFDEKHFTKDKSRHFGFKALCLKCNRKSCAERRLRNLETSRERDRERYANNPARNESAKSRANARYESNREQIIEYVSSRAKARRDMGLPRVINEEKREAALRKNRLRCRKNYHQDIETSRAMERSRIRTAKDYKTRKTWRQNNPGKIRAGIAKRKSLLEAASGGIFTKTDIESLRKRQNGHCFYCNVRMTPEGKLRETIDHKLAVSKGGSNAPENIVLACLECNMAKSNQDFEIFLKRTDRPRFSSRLTAA